LWGATKFEGSRPSRGARVFHEGKWKKTTSLNVGASSERGVKRIMPTEEQRAAVGGDVKKATG